MTLIRFADGTTREVAEPLASRVVGLDADGDLLVPLTEGRLDYLAPLTPCCNASGKGTSAPTGVSCRACYRTVSPKYGSWERIAVPLAVRPHDRGCLAYAIICAVENVRDNDNAAWDVTLETANFAEIGQGYLDDGTLNCRC